MTLHYSLSHIIRVKFTLHYEAEEDNLIELKQIELNNMLWNYVETYVRKSNHKKK
jgi:hypothetical protein